MKAKTLATLTIMAVQQIAMASTTKQNGLDDLSLEELLELRENILEAKQNPNLTYYIEESDDEIDEDDEDDDDDDDDENGELEDSNNAD